MVKRFYAKKLEAKRRLRHNTRRKYVKKLLEDDFYGPLFSSSGLTKKGLERNRYAQSLFKKRTLNRDERYGIIMHLLGNGVPPHIVETFVLDYFLWDNKDDKQFKIKNEIKDVREGKKNGQKYFDKTEKLWVPINFNKKFSYDFYW